MNKMWKKLRETWGQALAFGHLLGNLGQVTALTKLQFLHMPRGSSNFMYHMYGWGWLNERI